MIAPALATTPEQDALFKAEREPVAARVAERNAAFARENARRKALCERIGGVRIGLNTEGVLKSCWGRPAKVNVTTTATHNHEQWVYDAGYVYLTDGLVTAIQTSR